MPSLTRLRSPIRPAAEWLFQLGRTWEGVTPRLQITSVRRTWTEQARLYKKSVQGGCRTGCSAFPAAPPGHSLHQYGLAWDMVRQGIDPFGDELLAELGHVWNSIGGGWHATDPIHFEVRPGPGR